MPVATQTPVGVQPLIKVKELFQKRLASAPSVTAVCMILFFIAMLHGRGGGGSVDDLIELTTVQPDPTTLRAVINLDTLTLSNREFDHACRTQ
jgi:hypothetical protein